VSDREPSSPSTDCRTSRDLEPEDDVLIRLIRAGDETALTCLLRRHRDWVRRMARARYFLPGSDPEDVDQEAMIGLFRAIKAYDLAGSTPFRPFAGLCIRRHMCTVIRMANRRKHEPLNKSLSLDAPVGDGARGDVTVADFCVAAEPGPAEVVSYAECIDELRTFVEHNLTALEQEVLRLYLEGGSYNDIARALRRQVRSIDNALQRVKDKLHRQGWPFPYRSRRTTRVSVGIGERLA